VLSPPRERPKASRSWSVAPSLSFDAAPCGRLGVADDLHGGLSGQMRRRTTPGTRGMLMRPHHRRVGAHRPPRVGPTLSGLVAATAQLIQDLTPGALGRPAAMSVIDGFPVPVATRQIPPRAPGPSPPQHPVDHRPVIGPASTPTRHAIRQQRRQPSPLPISQIMTIKHTDDLPDPPQEIHGTRPSPRRAARGVGGAPAATRRAAAPPPVPAARRSTRRGTGRCRGLWREPRGGTPSEAVAVIAGLVQTLAGGLGYAAIAGLVAIRGQQRDRTGPAGSGR
jgi:hypothetical protein